MKNLVTSSGIPIMQNVHRSDNSLPRNEIIEDFDDTIRRKVESYIGKQVENRW